MADCQHIAVIMDGNGRWANKRGLPRLAGHQAGTDAVTRAIEACCELNIRYLTLFGFSSENWNRPADEVSGLMKMLKFQLDRQVPKLMKNGIRFRAIGDLDRLPDEVRASLDKDIEETKNNSKMDLIFAVSYGGRDEIVAASRELAKKCQQGEISPEDISHDAFKSAMWSSDIPDPDLLIRTSGEMRISNFLLWQLAYSEIVVTDVLWPDFDKKALSDCIEQFSNRERRYGMSSQQIQEKLQQEKQQDKLKQQSC